MKTRLSLSEKLGLGFILFAAVPYFLALVFAHLHGVSRQDNKRMGHFLEEEKDYSAYSPGFNLLPLRSALADVQIRDACYPKQGDEKAVYHTAYPEREGVSQAYHRTSRERGNRRRRLQLRGYQGIFKEA